MRSRNVLRKCCYRSLKENRKRTAVTIVGILLATALITGVACMAVSFRASMVAYEKQENGDYHYHFTGVAKEYLKYFRENPNVESYSLTAVVGYAELEGSQNADKPYLYVRAMGKEIDRTLALTLTEGRLPETDSEIVIGRHARSNGFVDIKVGDMLTLQVGKRMSEGFSLGQETPYLGAEEELEPFFERSYTVVGIVERPNQEVEPRLAPGYSAFTFLNDAEAEVVDVYASYTKRGLRHREEVTAGILGVESELYERYYNGKSYTEEEQQQIRTVASQVQENYWLLKWELLIFSSRIMNMLYAMAGIAIVIIIVTSAFCIHNSFVISLTEKMQLYGRLSSVGTTGGQQRKIIYYEAGILGLTGIPLGMICGIAATAVLVKAVGGLVEDALGFRLVFGLSFPAMVFGALLSAITVYLSASGSARRAARISPISAIRGNDTVWIRAKELGCPAMIGKLFGIGGRIAYKNLRRARVKYRTTVVSIVVSVAVFIGMSTFVELLMYSSGHYYEEVPCQLRASIYQWKYYDEALRIAEMEGVEETEVVRAAWFPVDKSEISYSKSYKEAFTMSEEGTVKLYSLGNEAYERYCRNVGVAVEEAKDKGIVVADYEYESWQDGKLYKGEGEIAHFQPGEILQGTDTAAGIEIQVLVQTDVKPLFMQKRANYQIVIIVSDEWMENHTRQEMRYDNLDVWVRCEDADKMEKAIYDDLQLQHFTVTNFNAQYRSDRSFHLVTAIFLYGFITVVALIGITNIFNTVTTNMELRAPEFAMLRSMGMTGREFRRMIWLEGIFYGGKALLIGIPAGLLLSVCFNRAMGEGIVTEFRFPWLGTGTAAAAVVFLLFVIMRYSMRKINQRNMIETIRNENI